MEAPDRGTPQLPDSWPQRAAALERADRLEEAEALIRDVIPDVHFAIVIAEMYAGRMLRRRAAGDAVGTVAARQAAERWAWFLTTQASSGGEGLALADERDEFLAALRDR